MGVGQLQTTINVSLRLLDQTRATFLGRFKTLAYGSFDANADVKYEQLLNINLIYFKSPLSC